MSEEEKVPCVHLRRAGMKTGVCPICHGARRTYTEALYPFKPVRALPPNTLTNADGTPYSANNPVNEPAKIVHVRVDEPEDKEERRLHEELHGHAPLVCEVEYQGKIYAGTLYFDRLKK